MQEQLFLAPVGELFYPYLQTPRAFQNEAAKLAYDTKLRVFDPATAAEFVQWIDAWREEAARDLGGQLGLKSPYKVDLVDEDGRQFTEFTFRLKAAIQTKKGLWERRPVILMADGSAVGEGVDLGTGTIATISYTPYKWAIGGEAGVTLQPLGVMVHELREYAGGTAATPDDIRASMLEMATPGTPPPPTPPALPTPQPAAPTTAPTPPAASTPSGNGAGDF